MWYSATQIGIPEIDMDHQNIDAMLRLCFSGQVSEAALTSVIVGLLRHFEHEEAVIRDLGHDFPAEHHAEHQKFAETVRALEADWQAGKITGRDLAETLRLKLMSHVMAFDVKLTSL